MITQLEEMVFEGFKEVTNKMFGKTVLMQFTGTIREQRVLENFECCGHIGNTGYFLGSNDEDDLNVFIKKDNIKDIHDKSEEDTGVTTVEICFMNGDSLSLLCDI